MGYIAGNLKRKFHYKSKKVVRLTACCILGIVAGILLLDNIVSVLARPIKKDGESARPISQTIDVSTHSSFPVSSLSIDSAADDDAEIHDANSIGPEIVAWVNDTPIRLQEIQQIRTIDQAMARLLSQDPSLLERPLLERVINEELVWQAARKYGFSLAEGTEFQVLNALLTSNHISHNALQEMLNSHTIPRERFDYYLNRLITVERFIGSQRRQTGKPVDAIVDDLHSRAFISFGPAADIVDSVVISDPKDLASRNVTQQTTLDTQTNFVGHEHLENSVLERSAVVGVLAPTFRLLHAGSASQHIASLNDFSGAPLVLSFWTTWCPFCRQQASVLADAYAMQDAHKSSVQFVGINVKEKADKVEYYISTNNMPYPILLDTEGATSTKYNVRGFPTTYFLDENGQIIAHHVGALTAEKLEHYIHKLRS